jgi:hypothetical protein
MHNFFRKNEHHIWKDQSLFFHLHITCYYKYALGLQLLGIKWSVAQVLRRDLTLQLHPFAPSHNKVIQRQKSHKILSHSLKYGSH